MKTSTEIRLENARLLEQEAGGRKEMAMQLGMSEQQLGQILGPHPKRNIGPALARRIERVFAKEYAWMDQERVKDQVPGSLRDLQVQEAVRILNLLSDIDLSRALVWLQAFERNPEGVPKI